MATRTAPSSSAVDATDDEALTPRAPFSPAAMVGASIASFSPNINAFMAGSKAIADSPALPFRIARSLVSGSKMRFKDGGFDLDLSYVVPRVIALGLPATGLFEPLYRNPLSEVRRFFETYHPGKYTLINLCNERDYADDEFPGATILRYPFQDHHPPALAAVVHFCRRVEQLLRDDPENVVAVHCKAGKGRTGVMVCSWLLWSGQPQCNGDTETAVRAPAARPRRALQRPLAPAELGLRGDCELALDPLGFGSI